MLVGKLVKAMLIGVVLFAGLYLIAGNFLGPGVGDFSDSLANGYEYDYAGGNERAIVYRGDERPNTIIIDARVDGYLVIDDRLLVVRRPREIYKEGDVTKSRLSQECEYWVIDTKNHQVEKIQRSNEFQDLRCSGV